METETMSVRDGVRHRLQTGGWGLLLAWTGAVLLLPGQLGVLWYVWLVGVGMALLGVGAVGLALGLPPTGGTIILGAIGLLSGIGGLAGVTIPVVGLLLIGWGLASVVATTRRCATDGR
jgi:hypothetical protein